MNSENSENSVNSVNSVNSDPIREGRLHVDEHEGLVLVAFEQLVPRLHGDPVPHVLASLERAAAREKIAVFVHLRDSSPPGSESRKAAFARLGELREKIAAVVVILDGASLRVTAFRSFLVAARMMNLVRLPIHPCASIEQGRSELEMRYELNARQRKAIDRFVQRHSASAA